MLAQELFSRCDKETEKILKCYLSAMYHISDVDGNLSMNDIFKPYSLNKDTSMLDQYFCYLLYTAIQINNELKQLFNKYKLDIKRIMKFPNNNYDDILSEQIVCNYSDYGYEIALNQKPYSKLIIFGGIDQNVNRICIERIIYNGLKYHIYTSGLLKKIDNSELLKELENLAITKEKNKENISIGNDTKNGQNVFGEVLTDKRYEENPLIGREQEFRKFCANLMDREKSVIIYGNAGCGKTTLAKGLAYKIQKNEVPIGLKDRRIIKVEASELVSGCKYRGDAEERLLNLINELKKDKNNILYIDEIHTIMGLGSGTDNQNDVSNILKPALGDGEIKIIGATTTEEYRIIKADKAFSRRFIPVELHSLTDEEVLHILDLSTKRLRVTEGVRFNFDNKTKKDLLRLIIEVSKKKYQDFDVRYNPDAALTLLRSGYNYCKLDGKKNLSVDYMIEGIENSSLINSQGIEYFKEKAKTYCKK